jgi:hypothetical protein
LAHDANPVRDRQRLLLVVGDEQGRRAHLELDPSDLVAQLRPHLRVQGRQRLVEEQHGRLMASARARATRCCCPPDICPAFTALAGAEGARPEDFGSLRFVYSAQCIVHKAGLKVRPR